MNKKIANMKASNELPFSIMNHSSFCIGGMRCETSTAMFRSFNSPYWSDITCEVVGVSSDAPHLETALAGRRGILVVITTYRNDYFGTVKKEYKKYKVGANSKQESKYTKRKKLFVKK
jgi:hypothetical protein